MKNISKPSILVIDDAPDELVHQVDLGLNSCATTCVVHPQDVEMSDLENADLVLVDYRLENWSERDRLSVTSLQPATGMALAVVLREQVDQYKEGKPTAFALHTAHLGDIQGRFPPVTAQHVLSRMNNLEWIFPKTAPNRYSQMCFLAKAVQQLPSQWPEDSDDAASTVRQLLAMDDAVDSLERCWHDVRDCRVPVDELTAGGHGIQFIRWLLHQILPYPCFLWGEHWVAARLMISVDALSEVLAGNSELAEKLNSMRYSGILAGFLGDRWWRGALEDYVWSISEGHKAGGKQLREALNKLAGMKLESIDINPAFVGLDAELKPTGRVLSAMNAITVRPDHWPTFADSAWMAIETVRDDSTLMSIVDPLDFHRINIDD